MNDTALVNSVVKFQSKKTQVKSRQKTDLEVELEPWKADIGDEILRVRTEKGASIADIANIIGIQNRTFIYDAIRAANVRNGSVKEVKISSQIIPAINNEPDEVKPYTIEYGDGLARVTFDETEYYDVVIIDGQPDIPEEWGEHTRERRDLYKQIVAEIKRHGG